MALPRETLHLGDDVSTDDIIPARRCTTAEPAHLARFAFEHLLGEGVLERRYDRIEAGRNFGCGSSREHAPLALRAAGVRAVRARSFAEIFFRNAVNIGLVLESEPALAADPLVERIVAAGGLSEFNRRRRRGAAAVPRGGAGARPMTLAEKIIARASGNEFVAPGETVLARVDLAMSHDAVAAPVARQFHETFGRDARLWDASRVVLVADHFIQVNDIRDDPRAPALLREMREFAGEQGCLLFDSDDDGDAEGICHVLLPERGLIRPGMLVAGTDSHSCTYGAFGCFAAGVGTTDMANLFAMGDLWIRVPPTHLFELHGRLPAGTCAKDIMLFLLGQIGCDGAAGAVMEFRGPVVERLSMDERATLSNMAIECGAVCGVVAPDETTRDFLRRRAAPEFDEVRSDPDAIHARTHRFDLDHLEPQVARPPRPDQVVPVSRVGDVAVSKAFIGSCTGGKLDDLAAAAAVLDGRRVAAGTELYIVPASREVRRQAARLGYLEIFERAGANVLATACGACINAGRGVLGAGEVGVYAINRNFRGRSGDASGRAYLASPRVVAISAVRGAISGRLD